MTVTLITGDRVTVRGGAAVTVEPAAGREHVNFLQEGGGGQIRVVPSDAAQLVAEGRLDERLFDVSYLIAEGYDDASRDSLPLLVDGGLDVVREVTSGSGSNLTRELPATELSAIAQRRASAGTLWARLAGEAAHPGTKGREAGVSLPPTVRKVWLDSPLRIDLRESVPRVGAPAAWRAGFDGEGVTVAVLDTGIDAGHPDLAGRVKAARNFTTDASADDGYGHGTHVASTIAGTGAASGGAYTGVAPGADLLNGKVCNSGGHCETSWVLAGMEWAATSGADVVNMSLGGDQTDGTDPLSQAVDLLTAKYDVLFVVAAGNNGPATGTVTTPGAADAALTVAAVDKADHTADFSGRGPRRGDFAVKPDIAAPGVGIAAARAAGTDMGTPVDDHYTSASGTSMATPHVAGAAAILAQRHPDWPADRLKAGLMATAAPTAASPFEIGTGRVDLERAVTQSVGTDAPTLSFGLIRWPHDVAPVARPVTYRNEGDSAVVLQLDVAAADQAGRPAPAHLFTVAPPLITVPAGGTATAVLTMIALGAPAGSYGGRLTATSADGTVSVRSAVGATLEPESYDLTVRLLDRNGQPPAESATWRFFDVFDYTTGLPGERYPAGATVRLPAGSHFVRGIVGTPRPDRRDNRSGLLDDLATVAYPELTLTADTELVLDARQARKVRVSVDRDTARPRTMVSYMAVRSQPATGWGHFVYGVSAGTPWTPLAADVYVHSVGASDKFFHAVMTQWEEPLLRLDVSGPQRLAVDVFYADDVQRPRTPLPPGTHRMGLVHGGGGTPDELRRIDATGRLVVLDLPPEQDADLAGRIANVRAAGGRAVLLDRSPLDTPGIPFMHVLQLPTLLAADPQRSELVRLARDGNAAVTTHGVTASPYQYNLFLPTEGRVPAEPVYPVRDRDLGTVEVDYRAVGPALPATLAEAWFRDRHFELFSLAMSAAPVRRREHYSAGPVQWQRQTFAGGRIELITARTEYRPGVPVHDTDLKGVIGPSFAMGPTMPYGTAPPAWIYRHADTIEVWRVPTHVGTGPARTASPFAEPSGYTRLYRDDALVGQTTEAGRTAFTVSPGRARYRLEVGAAPRFRHWAISTNVTASWTFSSETTAGQMAAALPLMAVRFEPALDDHNRGPAGREVRFPVRVEHQAGSTAAAVTELAVDASYDDGVTWRPVALHRVHDRWEVIVTNPPGGFVTLRATAADAAGNTVRQTIERAYGVGR